MGLFSGLGEAHDVILEGPGEQSWWEKQTDTHCKHCNVAVV